ncbi:MAG: glycosyl hydrolase family 28-related protein, partial [Candidatus Poribacteria bacterium]
MSILKANIRKALPNKFEEIRQNLFLPEYNVKHFGANGDGVTDDTEEVQAAIDAAEASGGGRVIFPAGIYPINVTVETSGVDLVGQSFTSTWLIPHDTTQPIVTVGNLGDTASDRIDDIHIVGLQFTDNNTNIYAQNTDTTLLFLHNVGNNSVIANCRFSGSLGYGILAEGFQDSVIQNCTFISLGQNAPARYGIYITSIDGGAGYMSPNNIRFEHCTFHGDQGNSF